MSNYAPIITFATKDALTHLDPNKAIKGAQLDNELNAIATAISTKQDTTVSTGTFVATFSGPFAAPVAVTVNWIKINKFTTLAFPNIQGTFNAVATNTAHAGTGTISPSIISIDTLANYATSPANCLVMPVGNVFSNSGNQGLADVFFSVDGSIDILKLGSNWATAGQNGISPFTVTYRST